VIVTTHAIRFGAASVSRTHAVSSLLAVRNAAGDNTQRLSYYVLRSIVRHFSCGAASSCSAILFCLSLQSCAFFAAVLH
jgi:hypothetical protein